jgi:hypothetical protein
MGNIFYHRDVQDVKKEVLDLLQNVPEHRKEVEKALIIGIQESANIPLTYKLLFGSITAGFISAIGYIAYTQNLPWSVKKSARIIAVNFEPKEIPKNYFKRDNMETKVTGFLGRSNLIIVYGPKLTGMMHFFHL